MADAKTDPAIDTNSIAAFAQMGEAVGSTRSRLAKVSAAAEWLRHLDGERLILGARYLGGRVFPGWDGRTLGIGGATLSKLLAALTGATREEMLNAWHRHADAGDVMFELYTPRAATGEVDLLDVGAAMAEVATIASAQKRVDALRVLLTRCSALEAKYVFKLITGELRIGLSEGLVEAAIAQAFGSDADLISRAHMLEGDLGRTALLASTGQLAEATPKLFAPLRFMLASPVADATEVIVRLGNEVWVEDKYDGVRCQLHTDGSRIALYSRDLRDVTAQFPEIRDDGTVLPAGTILDGEILAFKEGRVMPFAALQTRLGRVAPTKQVQESVPVVYVAWDVLMQHGAPTLDESLRARRERLDGLKLRGRFATAHMQSAGSPEDVERIFDEVRARLNEGLMAKNPDSPYLPGRRGLHWLKLKRPLDTLDVVVVGAEWGHGKRRGVLSDVTFAVRGSSGDLLTVGKAYTGLTDAEILEMTALLQELTTATYGRYHSVTPEIVLEIAFDTIQESRRHKAGYALRFPRIVQWRRDKAVNDIDGIDKVVRLATMQANAFNQKIERAESTP